MTVTISYLAEGVSLDVRDDSVGLESATRAATRDGLVGGAGLQLMLERVEEIGGTRLIESGAGEGTSIVVQLPTPNNEPGQPASALEVS